MRDAPLFETSHVSAARLEVENLLACVHAFVLLQPKDCDLVEEFLYDLVGLDLRLALIARLSESGTWLERFGLGQRIGYTLRILSVSGKKLFPDAFTPQADLLEKLLRS